MWGFGRAWLRAPMCWARLVGGSPRGAALAWARGWSVARRATARSRQRRAAGVWVASRGRACRGRPWVYCSEHLFAIIGVVGGDSRGTEGLVGVGIADRIGQLAARVHSTTAELVGLAADFDEGHGWDGYGIRSCAHWLAINAGTDVWNGMEMVRVGYALLELPLLAAAFASGALAFDKVLHVTRVAQAVDEALW